MQLYLVFRPHICQNFKELHGKMYINVMEDISEKLKSVACSLQQLGKKYFTKLITTLGAPSLDRLASVAGHSHLAQLVTILEIRLLNHREVLKVLTTFSWYLKLQTQLLEFR